MLLPDDELMSAKRYNEIRRILFCTVHKPSEGFCVAFQYLDKYRVELGEAGYVGLRAELSFYERFRSEFALTVAGDMGEHADFAGQYGTEATRFDVTTNIDFKKFKDYEPYMGAGVYYKIALLDRDTFEVIDVLDLAFPKCDLCGGHLVPCLVLLGQNLNRHGDTQWSNDQILLNVCVDCGEHEEEDRYTHHFMPSLSEIEDSDQETHSNRTVQDSDQYLVKTYKYFRREYCDLLMAIGGHEYVVTDPPTGDGHWAFHFPFVNGAVADIFPREVDCSFDV
jgi:hypothetical protein